MDHEGMRTHKTGSSSRGRQLEIVWMYPTPGAYAAGHTFTREKGGSVGLGIHDR